MFFNPTIKTFATKTPQKLLSLFYRLYFTTLFWCLV